MGSVSALNASQITADLGSSPGHAPKTPFVAPNGVRLVRIDRTSGKRVFGAWPGDEPKSAVIWEAFKAETEPKRSIRQEELAARGDKPVPRAVTKTQAAPRGGAAQAPASTGTQRDRDFLQKEGGIY